jgi:hypothetical protein
VRKPREPRLTARMGVVVGEGAGGGEQGAVAAEGDDEDGLVGGEVAALDGLVGEAEVGGAVGLEDGGEAVAGEPAMSSVRMNSSSGFCGLEMMAARRMGSQCTASGGQGLDEARCGDGRLKASR